jgi:polyphosphate glucokinase
VVLMLTLGTGIGSAFFYRGRLFPNTEFGHIELMGGDAEKYAAASVRVRENLDWQPWAERLDRYLAEMEKLISPDLIVLGGGISENYDRYKAYLTTSAEIRVAQLGNEAGILGAALAVYHDI